MGVPDCQRTSDIVILYVRFQATELQLRIVMALSGVGSTPAVGGSAGSFWLTIRGRAKLPLSLVLILAIGEP